MLYRNLPARRNMFCLWGFDQRIVEKIVLIPQKFRACFCGGKPYLQVFAFILYAVEMQQRSLVAQRLAELF
jgi:hypothetical protein